MKPRKHKDVIIQWANGAIVQFKEFGRGEWKNVPNVPGFYDDYQYRASIAEVEGKPVFEGDVLYQINGERCEIKGGMYYGWHMLSWNPPRPKTITVKLLRDDAEYLNSGSYDHIKSWRIHDAVEKALKEVTE